MGETPFVTTVVATMLTIREWPIRQKAECKSHTDHWAHANQSRNINLYTLYTLICKSLGRTWRLATLKCHKKSTVFNILYSGTLYNIIYCTLKHYWLILIMGVPITGKTVFILKRPLSLCLLFEWYLERRSIYWNVFMFLVWAVRSLSTRRRTSLTRSRTPPSCTPLTPGDTSPKKVNEDGLLTHWPLGDLSGNLNK